MACLADGGVEFAYITIRAIPRADESLRFGAVVNEDWRLASSRLLTRAGNGMDKSLVGGVGEDAGSLDEVLLSHELGHAI